MGPGVDPRTPVLVGTGQHNQRVDQGEPPLEPVDLMVEALRRAERDTGATGVLRQADSVRAILELSWRYADPAALVADRLGARPRTTGYTVMGGNYVQTVVNRTALDILAGRADLVLVTGGEAWRTRTATKKVRGELHWTHQPEGTEPSFVVGAGDPPLSHPFEIERGAYLPVHFYPMVEVALRAANGLGVDEHRARIGRLWSEFSEIAARNPNAWIRRERSPEELTTPSPENRMIGYPYPKLLNSNNAVEQSAGLILCSVERAESLGIPRERWVFVHAGADGHDHLYASNRVDLHSSPGMRIAGRAALDLAGAGIDDVAHVDLYSCFPSAVQVAAQELGLSLERPLTVTGGMSFAGGPWNNYVMHAVATMADVLRSDPGALGLCSANGGYLTKHSFGVYSTDPPRAGAFRHARPQAQIDALPSCELDTDHHGPVEIETYTVMHDRDGQPEVGLLATRTPDDRRSWARTDDPATMKAMLNDDLVGQPGTQSPEGDFELA